MFRLALIGALCLAGAIATSADAGDAPDAAADGAVPVKIVSTKDGFQLLRNAKPYFIKGVGGAHRLEMLAAAGGNSFRTWGAQEFTETRTGADGVRRPLLDEAQRLGLTVCAGFWMEHGRHGYDYTEPAFVQEQLESIGNFVQTYKDHPAILIWALGNEVENGEGNPDDVYRAIEQAAKLVKDMDPNHPTMTVIAEVGDDKAAKIQKLCPHIDILGINSYGGLQSLPGRLAKQGFTKPYVVTEFGPLGHWETGHTPWGAPYEQTSTQKAEFLRKGYDASIANQPNCFGSYAFLWGHKQERTATWYGMFLDSGERTASLDELQYIWTGRWPENRAPSIQPIQFGADVNHVRAGATIPASVEALDPNGDELAYRWIVRPESSDRQFGGDREAAPPDLPNLTAGAEGPKIEFTAPKEPGAYRLFVYVRDGRGNAATANVPFNVD